MQRAPSRAGTAAAWEPGAVTPAPASASCSNGKVHDTKGTLPMGHCSTDLPARANARVRRGRREVVELRNSCKGNQVWRGPFAKAGKSSSFSPPL